MLRHQVHGRLLTALPALAAIAAVTSPAAAQAAYPGADGRIVFHNDRSIYTAAPTGGTPTRLPMDAPGFGGLSVSADGTQIVYDASHRILIVAADGSGPRALTDTRAFSDNPAISPDGRRIAFEREHGLWVMNADGSDAHSITPAADFSHSYSDPAWSPDGSRIAYTLQQQVWVMNADGSGAVDLTPPDKLCPLMTRTMYGSQPDWSPDGRRIVFTGPVSCANSRGTDIWVMNADGSGKANLIGDDATEDRQPVFSPSGRQIAFTRDDANGAPRLATMGAAGGAITSVALPVPSVNGPVWSVALRPVRLSVTVASRGVHAGGRLVIAGRARPSVSGRVTLLITRGGKRVARRTLRLSHGRFRLRYRPRSAGSYRVVATLAPGHGHLSATSRARMFRVGH